MIYICCKSNFSKSKHAGGNDLNISKFHRFFKMILLNDTLVPQCLIILDGYYYLSYML